MSQLQRVSQLAKNDYEAALKFSSRITNDRELIQALGWIMRFAPPKKMSSLIKRVTHIAKKSMRSSSDMYPVVMSLAWPLRALHETDNSRLIPPLLALAIKNSTQVSPASSRAEALELIIAAVIPSGARLAAPAIDALTSQCAGDDHWRVVLAFADTAFIVKPFDSARAKAIAEAIPSANKRKSVLERFVAGESRKPRPFFW